MIERKTRRTTEEKRDAVVIKALDYAIRHGFENFKRDEFCHAIGIGNGSINYYFENMPFFKSAVMRKAVENNVVPVVAHGIATRCSVAHDAPDDLKQLAISHILANY